MEDDTQFLHQSRALTLTVNMNCNHYVSIYIGILSLKRPKTEKVEMLTNTE